jgi:hypothetical protein
MNKEQDSQTTHAEDEWDRMEQGVYLSGIEDGSSVYYRQPKGYIEEILDCSWMPW